MNYQQWVTYFLIQLLKSCVHLGHVSVRHVVYRDRKCFSQSWVKGHRIYLSVSLWIGSIVWSDKEIKLCIM